MAHAADQARPDATAAEPEEARGPSSGQRSRGEIPDVPTVTRWNRMWRPFWALPAACVIAAVVLGILLPQWEEELGVTRLQYVFQGGPDGAREVLGTIASAMISVTGLVFSITMVVLQLASSQFTPRVLGGFLQYRVVQGTLGIFLSTFVFALTVTRYVRGDNEGEQFVPQLSVTLAFLMTLACVGFFLAFIHRITTSIQVSHVISRIGDRTLKLADVMYPELAAEEPAGFGPTWSPEPGTARVSPGAPRHGVIVHVDYKGLARWAAEHDAVVTVDRPVGQFIAEGQQVLGVWGVEELSEDEVRWLYSFLGLSSQREMKQDVAFGIRQLADIADRALSSGINDPTTAVQCLDELHRVLRRLVQRASPSPYIADADGQVRVVHDPQAINDLVDLAVLEIAHFGTDTMQVPQRLRMMLEDLLQVCAPRYRAGVERLLEGLPDPATEEEAAGGSSGGSSGLADSLR